MTKVKRARITAETHKTHVCKCGKAFSTKDLLRRHIRRRYAVKKHICDFPGCGYKTMQSYHLVVHKRKHINERPYSCDFPGCDYTCAQSSSMIRHKITHTGEKLHVCDFPDCDYTSSTPYDLVRHKRKHTGEKNYSCDSPHVNTQVQLQAISLPTGKYTQGKNYMFVIFLNANISPQRQVLSRCIKECTRGKNRFIVPKMGVITNPPVRLI